MKKFMLCYAIPLLSLTGCVQENYIKEGPAPGISIHNANAPYATLRLNSVAILDRSLQSERSGKLAIESTTSRRTPTDTLEAIAVIRNRTNNQQVIEARVQFFDAAGVPLEGPTAWKRIFLDPNGISAYREFSVRTGDVANYYIEIREAR